MIVLLGEAISMFALPCVGCYRSLLLFALFRAVGDQLHKLFAL